MTAHYHVPIIAGSIRGASAPSVACGMSQATHHDRLTIRVECTECDEVDVTTTVEHSPDSRQASSVRDAHELLARDHEETTGHSVTIDETPSTAN